MRPSPRRFTDHEAIPMDHALDEFQRHREHLFAIAYRMLGSVSDAEDTLQEVYLRWRNVDQAALGNPVAYLRAIATRASIDRLRKVQTLREDYIGPWLPQPVIGSSLMPDSPSAMAESLSMAFLILLERLNPTERAIFLLRESFEFDYDEIASIVGKSEVNCRQIFRRSRDRLADARPRFKASLAEQMQLTVKFQQALQHGELDDLISLLAEDIQVCSDGGGKVSAARFPMIGQQRAGRFLLGSRKFTKGMPLRPAILNGQPGILFNTGADVVAATIIDIRKHRIERIYIIQNPDKLGGLAIGSAP